MSRYLVAFAPAEPYYFGNEKGFAFPGEKQLSYFIRGERTPSQSTVLGALRYLLLPYKKSGFDYTPEELAQNAAACGPESFDPEKDQTFGRIKSISPVFIVKNGAALLPTPMDHRVDCANYTPFSEYRSFDSDRGEVLCTDQYDAKKGTALSYTRLDTGEIVPEKEIFGSETRIGIQRSEKRKGFFKKQYCTLKRGCEFAVISEIEGETPDGGCVFMGQGKSTFSVTFVPAALDLNEFGRFLDPRAVYLASDAFLPGSIYNDVCFAATRIKTYRKFSKYGFRAAKGETLYCPVAAGSVFLPRNKTEFVKTVASAKPNAYQIGFNRTIINTEE